MKKSQKLWLALALGGLLTQGAGLLSRMEAQPTPFTIINQPQSQTVPIGTEIGLRVDFTGDCGEWIEDWHWVEYSEWVETGHWVDDGYWEEQQQWVDTSHWENNPETGEPYWVPSGHYMIVQVWVPTQRWETEWVWQTSQRWESYQRWQSRPPFLLWFIGEKGDTSTIAWDSLGPDEFFTTVTHTVSYWVRISGPNVDSVDSETAYISVYGQVSITRQPQSIEVIEGYPVTFTVEAQGEAPLQYQWYLGGAGDTSHPITDATNAQCDLSASTYAGYNSIWVEVWNVYGHAFSEAAYLTVHTDPYIIRSPANVEANYGARVVLAVESDGTQPIACQWYRGQKGDTSQPITDAQGAIYETDILTEDAQFWVLVWNSLGQVMSETALVTVRYPPQLVAPLYDVVIAYGDTAHFVAQAAGVAPLSFQWYRDGSPITGATTSNLDITLGDGYSGAFRVMVQNRDGVAWSDPVSIVHAPYFTETSATPDTILYGGDTVLKTGILPLAPASFQWYLGASGDTSQPLPSTANLWTNQVITTNSSFWVRAINAWGTTDSPAVTIWVIDPVILKSPASVATIYGQRLVLAVECIGTQPIACQWYRGQKGDFSQPITDAQGADYLTDILTEDIQFWVKVWNSLGQAMSETAWITVRIPPQITSQPQDTNILPGQSATFRVTATGVPVPAYQWYQGESGDKSQPISGATGDSYDTGPLTADAAYWVDVANVAGEEYSRTVWAHVFYKPQITLQPQSQSVVAITEVTFSAAASGSAPLCYQWYFNGIPIPDETNANLTISPAVPAHEGTYNVVVTNAAGADTSWSATLAVDPYWFTTLGTREHVVRNGPVEQAAFAYPYTVAVDRQGRIFVGDWHGLRFIANGYVNTLAGDPMSSGLADGRPAKFVYIVGIVFDAGGNIIVLDYGNSRVRKVAMDGWVSTVAGTDPGWADGTPGQFRYPWGMAADGNGNLYVSDYGNNALRKITPAGEVSTIVGVPGQSGFSLDPPTLMNQPYGVAVTDAGEIFFIDQGNNLLRKIDATGKGSILAGKLLTPGYADGQGDQARFTTPYQLALDKAGNLYTAEFQGHVIRKITAGGLVTTIAGSVGAPGFTDGAGKQSRFSNPIDVAVDDQGNLYVADHNNGTIRRGQLLCPQVILRQPQSANGIEGSDLVLSVNAFGMADLAYQWRRNEVPLVDDARLVGAHSAALTFANLQPSDQGTYSVVVSTVYGSVTSAPASLAVLTPSRITAQPQNQTVVSGQPAQLSVTVTGSGPITYQWYEGVSGDVSHPIPDAQSDTLDLASVDRTAHYWVRVSFPAGPQDSQTATVTESLALIAGQVTGYLGTEILLPVKAYGFRGVATLQFSLHWDPAVADYVGVEQFGLPGLAMNNFGIQASQGILTVSWEDPAATGQTVANGSTLFALRLRLVGTLGAASAVVLNGHPTPIEAGDDDLSPLPLTSVPGQVKVIESISVAGTVMLWSSQPVEGTTLNLTGAAGQSALTDVQGAYALAYYSLGEVTLTPAKMDDNPTVNGVSTIDILRLRRHILGINPLTAPFGLLAADVNASQSVSTADITLMRKLILGLTNQFPAGLWRFVPADYAFPDPASPWDPATSRAYSNLVENLSGQDFTAIKLGDVDGSWEPPSLTPQSLRPQALNPDLPIAVTLRLDSQVANAGDEVLAKVSLGRMRRLTSLQFTIAWDPAILQFTGLADFGLPELDEGNFGLNRTNTGRVMLSWDDPQAEGLAVADDTVLFTLRFKVVGNPGAVGLLVFADDPTTREATVNAQTTAVLCQNGLVAVRGAAMPPVILRSPASLTLAEGGTTTLAVLAAGDEPLQFQWYLGTSGDESQPVPAATAAEYTIPPLTKAAAYWAKVRNPYGAAASQTALLTTIPPPSFQAVSAAPGQLDLTLQGPPGTWWEIQYSEDMVTWRPLYTFDWVLLENGSTSIQLPVNLTGHNFFRVMLSP